MWCVWWTRWWRGWSWCAENSVFITRDDMCAPQLCCRCIWYLSNNVLYWLPCSWSRNYQQRCQMTCWRFLIPCSGRTCAWFVVKLFSNKESNRFVQLWVFVSSSMQPSATFCGPITRAKLTLLNIRDQIQDKSATHSRHPREAHIRLFGHTLLRRILCLSHNHDYVNASQNLDGSSSLLCPTIVLLQKSHKVSTMDYDLAWCGWEVGFIVVFVPQVSCCS